MGWGFFLLRERGLQGSPVPDNLRCETHLYGVGKFCNFPLLGCPRSRWVSQFSSLRLPKFLRREMLFFLLLSNFCPINSINFFFQIYYWICSPTDSMVGLKKELDKRWKNKRSLVTWELIIIKSLSCTSRLVGVVWTCENYMLFNSINKIGGNFIKKVCASHMLLK